MANEWKRFSLRRIPSLVNAHVHSSRNLAAFAPLVIRRLLAVLQLPDLSDEACRNAVTLIFRLGNIPSILALLDLEIPGLFDTCYDVLVECPVALSAATLRGLVGAVKHPDTSDQCKTNILYLFAASLRRHGSPVACVLSETRDLPQVLLENSARGNGVALSVLAHCARWREKSGPVDSGALEAALPTVLAIVDALEDAPSIYGTRATLALADLVDACIHHWCSRVSSFGGHRCLIKSLTKTKMQATALCNLVWIAKRVHSPTMPFEPCHFYPLLESTDRLLRKRAFEMMRVCLWRLRHQPYFECFQGLLNIWKLDSAEDWYLSSCLTIKAALRRCATDPRRAAGLVKNKFVELL
jgi:hypothetical protein